MTSKEQYKTRIRALAKRSRQELHAFAEHAELSLSEAYPRSKELLDAIEAAE